MRVGDGDKVSTPEQSPDIPVLVEVFVWVSAKQCLSIPRSPFHISCVWCTEVVVVVQGMVVMLSFVVTPL